MPCWTMRCWPYPFCPKDAASLLYKPLLPSSLSSPATSTWWTSAASRARYKDTFKKQTNTIFTKWKLYFRHFILWFVFRVFAYEQQDPLSPSPYTALILHRLALDCNFEAQNLGFNCTTTQGQVRVETRTQDKTTLHFCMIRGLFCSIFKFSCIVISVICNFFLSCLMTFKNK